MIAGNADGRRFLILLTPGFPTSAIELPRVPIPVANFVPFRRCGNLVFLAGQVCEWNGVVRYVGRVGVDYDLPRAGGRTRLRP